ncbi:MAG: hypothetical protein K9J51_08945, partial [Desulfotignum sp.]|nr:hypothetical protein [Desulfotignum sp.]
DDYEKQDSMDIPECFGEFSKNNRLCISYCAISIRCCIMQSKHPKIGILEKLLIHNQYAPKPH